MLLRQEPARCSGPLRSGGCRRLDPQGGVQDARRFFAGAWTHHRKIPSAHADFQDMDVLKALRRGVISFGYFSLDKQRKVTRPRSGWNALLLEIKETKK